MIHFLHMRAKDEPGTAQIVAGSVIRGDIEVVVSGEQLDRELVPLACLVAKKAKCRIHLVSLIEVPRALPLAASLKRAETQQAEALLADALALTEKAGCKAQAEVLHVRDAAPAIVEEARDQHCALILLGQGPNTDHRVHNDVGRVIAYVLTHAPCRVWVIQDQQAA
jgi:nucleotide-binding universal stress UspA family protein